MHPLVVKTARRARLESGKADLRQVYGDVRKRGLQWFDELDRQGIHRVMQTPFGCGCRDVPTPKKRDEKLRAAYGASQDRPLIFFPHRLLEEKGINEVLRSAAAHRR